MILIADSGSTKTEWQVVNDSKRHFFSSGINPYYQSADEILSALQKEISREQLADITQVYFYGAGCNTPQMKATIKKALELFHFKSAHIEVESDLLGAARSLCQRSEGISCILGTGSNSCLYDGHSITANISPLGYILGDEGSGAVLGKKLIAAVLKNQLPKSVCNRFFESYNYEVGELLSAVYKEAFPNRFLAQFSRFIVANIDEQSIEELVMEEFHLFFKRNVMQYEEHEKLPIHFVGSVAYYYSKQLEQVMKELKLKLGIISQTPIQGLIQYHSI